MYYQTVAGCFTRMVGQCLLNLFLLDVSNDIPIEDVRVSNIKMDVLKINVFSINFNINCLRKFDKRAELFTPKGPFK